MTLREPLVLRVTCGRFGRGAPRRALPDPRGHLGRGSVLKFSSCCGKPSRMRRKASACTDLAATAPSIDSLIRAGMMLSTVLQILRHDVFCLPFEAKATEWSDPWGCKSWPSTSPVEVNVWTQTPEPNAWTVAWYTSVPRHFAKNDKTSCRSDMNLF